MAARSFDEILAAGGYQAGSDSMSDPYASIRSLGADTFIQTQDEWEEGVDGRRQISAAGYTYSDAFDQLMRQGGFQSKYNRVTDLGDGRISVRMQQPGAHKYDTMDVIYQRNAQGGWDMVGTPRNTREVSSMQSQFHDSIDAIAPIALAAAAGSGLAAYGGLGAGTEAAAAAVGAEAGAAGLGSTGYGGLGAAAGGGAGTAVTGDMGGDALAQAGQGGGGELGEGTLGQSVGSAPSTGSTPLEPTGGTVPTSGGGTVPPVSGMGPTGGAPSAWDQLLSGIGNGVSSMGMRDWLSVLSGIYGLNLASNMRDEMDPFRSQRGYYAERLRELEENPGAITRRPGYRAGLDAINAEMASRGYFGGGNHAVGLMRFSGDFMGAEQDRLARLAGGYAQPGAGMPSSTNLTGQSLASIGYGLAPYSPNRPRAGGGAWYGGGYGNPAEDPEGVNRP